MTKVKDAVLESYKGNITKVEDAAKMALDELAIQRLDELKQVIGQSYFAQLEEGENEMGLLAQHGVDFQKRSDDKKKKRKSLIPTVRPFKTK